MIRRVFITARSGYGWWYDRMLGKQVDIDMVNIYNRGSQEAYYLANTFWTLEIFKELHEKFRSSFFIERRHYEYVDEMDNESLLIYLRSFDELR